MLKQQLQQFNPTKTIAGQFGGYGGGGLGNTGTLIQNNSSPTWTTCGTSQQSVAYSAASLK